MEELQHFCHQEHGLVFTSDVKRSKIRCWGCKEPILGPSYSCIKCKSFYHHKSCAELPLWLHHPLHPLHPLTLFPEWKHPWFDNEFSKCEVCKEYRPEYNYRCSHCDFNLHIRCAVLQLEAEFHDHPLIPFCKFVTFTCDLCGKEGKGVPYQCASCGFWIHRRCGSFPRRVKVVRHKHPLLLIHSSPQLLQADSLFCQLCVQKVDTRYGLYYCSKCHFIAHIDCATNWRNIDDINLLEIEDEDSAELKTIPKHEAQELDESVASVTYKVKKMSVGEDGEKIATEIKYFNHEHDLKLSNEVQNYEKCDGCIQAILSPFYSCLKCSFLLHQSCAQLPKKKRHPLHQHPLTLLPKASNTSKLFLCNACGQYCNGFTYNCQSCKFNLDVQCSLISDILTHPGHEHQLILSNTTYTQKCSCCDNERNQVFRCTTCAFALDFKCATLPHVTRYKKHKHPFTLSYIVEDDVDEYYCDICEEERDSKHWFYYCEDCKYPAHPECILGKYPNCKFGSDSTLEHHLSLNL